MTREEKIKKECDKLTAEFDKLYGQQRIIVGRTKGISYMSIPNDPKEFVALIERMLQCLIARELADHLYEVVDRQRKVMEKLVEAAGLN